MSVPNNAEPSPPSHDGRPGSPTNSSASVDAPLSTFQGPGSPSSLPQANHRSVFFYVAVTLVAFSMAVTLWSSSSVKERASHCPDCNCGVEGGAPPVSVEGAEAILGVGLSIFLIQLALCVFATYLLTQNRFLFLPSCIAYVLLGVLVGSIVRVSGSANALGLSLPNQEQFFTFIIPPIILEAGYSLNKRDFFAEAVGIFVLAIPGTFISAVVFGLAIYITGVLNISYYFSFWEGMTFGALLSAVDPVATIAIFSALKVNKTLHFLVFGESVLNDAVAVVLYRTCSRLIGYSVTTWYGPILRFLYIFIGSPIIGAIVGAATALLLKHTSLFRTPSLEFSFYLIMAYLSYPFCDGLGMSGILGILASSIVLAQYAHHNLSKITQVSSQQSFRTLGFLAETFVFIYLGTALTTFNHSWHLATIICGIVFTLVSRAANIYPLTNLLNRWRSSKISRKTQLIMWFSGSLRGAIAWALSLSLPSRNGSDDTRRVVISSTLAIVLFTVIVFGGGMLPLLRLLRVEDEAEEENEGDSEFGNDQRARSQTEMSTLIETLLQRWDEKWLKPLLLASSTRAMVATNRTLQTLAVSDTDRLTPHELGSRLDLSAAIESSTSLDIYGLPTRVQHTPRTAQKSDRQPKEREPHNDDAGEEMQVVVRDGHLMPEDEG